MKEIILARSFNQHPIYVQGEVCEIRKIPLLILESWSRWFFSSDISIDVSILKVCSLSAARAEIGEFVEYDLDNEDEDWLQGYNKDKKILAPEK